MKIIDDTCDLGYSRKLETYLRREVLISFISDEKEILDVGCGSGFLTDAAANLKKVKKVVAVDINP